jgi:hypothetical protein
MYDERSSDKALVWSKNFLSSGMREFSQRKQLNKDPHGITVIGNYNKLKARQILAGFFLVKLWLITPFGVIFSEGSRFLSPYRVCDYFWECV